MMRKSSIISACLVCFLVLVLGFCGPVRGATAVNQIATAIIQPKSFFSSDFLFFDIPANASKAVLQRNGRCIVSGLQLTDNSLSETIPAFLDDSFILQAHKMLIESMTAVIFSRYLSHIYPYLNFW